MDHIGIYYTQGLYKDFMCQVPVESLWSLGKVPVKSLCIANLIVVREVPVDSMWSPYRVPVCSMSQNQSYLESSGSLVGTVGECKV